MMMHLRCALTRMPDRESWSAELIPPDRPPIQRAYPGPRGANNPSLHSGQKGLQANAQGSDQANALGNFRPNLCALTWRKNSTYTNVGPHPSALRLTC